ncbi:MAG: hypothetical protein GX592_13310 [Clostridiales bacterium]|nr:hypothetical protein [Clostridiales bacterium]
MKKLALLIAVLLLAAVASHAEVAPGSFLLEGVVANIEGGRLLVETMEFGDVAVLTDENTAWDVGFELHPGAYVYIDYDGQMTRSMPPQVMADSVRSHVLAGAIVEVYARDGALLIETEEHGRVYVRMPEGWDGAAEPGQDIAVYFSGIMALSMPAQVGAGLAVIGYTVEGEVEEIGSGFLIVGRDEKAIRVNFEPSAAPEGLEIGDYVRAFHDGRMAYSMPPQVSAHEIVKLNR